MPASARKAISLHRIASRTGLTFILSLILLYVGDYALWRIRGEAVSTIHVTRIVVAELKGNHEEYYPDGSADIPCSKSLFGQAGSAPCWQLRRHRTLYER